MATTSRPSRGSRLQKIRQRYDLPSDDDESDENDEIDENDVIVSLPPPPPPRAVGSNSSKENIPSNKLDATPSLDPYVGKLERYELFCTNQSYYLVGCNKLNTAYRVLKMDRTLIERPLEPQSPSHSEPHFPAPDTKNNKPNPGGAPLNNNTNPTNNNPPPENSQAIADATHNSKPTLRPLSEFLTEDPNVYSQEEIQDMLDMIHDGNRQHRADRAPGDASGQGGGLKPIVKAYGIVGFIRFLDCYYLTLITRRAKVGSIGGNGIYTIKTTETFPIKAAERVPGSTSDMDIHADPSSVLLSMWNRGKRSVGLGLTNREIAELRYQGLYQVVDLTKNFFFSYTYDLTRSLQENFLSTTSQPFPPPPFKDMYAWNHFLTRELEGCTNSLTSFHWVMPIIHGAFVQRKLNDYGRSLNVILLARRSRHFAGTRYLKRGVSEQGKVANDVEHEQIVHDESKSASNGIFSSYLQVRGSIPTFWTQESSVTMPKPPIELNRVDPTYIATQLHFEDLLKRYGAPIVVLDLVKQSEKREREVRVGNEYRHAIDYINTSIDDAHKIRYCALDYSHISKHRHLDVSTSLNEVSNWAVNQTGFFCSAPKWKIMEGGSIEPFNENDMNAASQLPAQLGVPVFPMEQTGVLRTNCIDCLDRTNVAQFSAGVEAMEQQLVVMGIRSNAKLDPSSNIVRVLIDMYVDIGDHIALQYGGSEAHKKVSTGGSESNIVGPIGKHKELLTSIRRYYSNAFTDRLKQDAMNLFLGYYVPYRHTIPLWEMETDYYLHNFHVKTGKGTLQSMKGYQRAFGVTDWNEDDQFDFSNEKDSSVVSSGSGVRPRRLHSRSITATSVDDSAFSNKQEDKSRRIATVRKRCKAQNQALSSWWKVAIQSNIQQRMWMQLGKSPSESMLPPRFERLYQPEKMAQFDRFFARSWATPVRRSHSAQHGEDSDDKSEIAEFRRNISGRNITIPKKEESRDLENDEPSHRGSTLHNFVAENLEPTAEPSLKMFIEHYDFISGRSIVSDADEASGATDEFDLSLPYIGDTRSAKENKRKEYIQYLNPSQDSSSSPFRPEAMAEFKDSLRALSLNADDVDGIRELAESAHIGRVISSGPYRGLFQDESAIEVATVIHEQFNALENMRSRGELREGIPLMDMELKRRGLYTAGVKGAVSAGWNRHMTAEKQYSELFNEIGSDCRRSDLTTPRSLKLYASFFSPDLESTTPDLSFMLGAGSSHSKHSRFDAAPRTSNFINKAAKLGIPIASHSDGLKSKSPPLFQFERRKPIPEGFEMINEDMFARKDNKFMVFNGAGVDSWSGTAPVTKTSGIETMLLGTLN